MKIVYYFLSLSLMYANFACADEPQDFNTWLNTLKKEALTQSISQDTIDATFKQVEFLPNVIALDRAQPEFISTFVSYLDKRVNPRVVKQGRALMKEQQVLLDKLETRYGVPRQILVSFWGLETNFGKMQGDFSLPSTLTTLAYEGRRAAFFRQELFNLMHIIEAQQNAVARMRGSWAGAMGQVQFMPSTFLNNAIDMDENGQIDIWTSIPDALGSAANYLSNLGWHTNEPVAVQIKLPTNFDYSLAQLKVRKSVTAWAQLGVEVPSQWLGLDNAAILLPQGWQGPAFMVFENYDVVMSWNRSVNYALAVSNLADWLIADAPIQVSAEAETEALSFNQIWALQAKLNELGFDCGDPDGFPGFNTQFAIREYQASKGLHQDGYASPSLYHQLLAN
jgi:membrane-bound lytic murein transglycosylase B